MDIVQKIYKSLKIFYIMKKRVKNITEKTVSEKKLRELIEEGKKIVSISGSHTIRIGEELDKIKKNERELRQKLSLLL